MRFKQWFSGGGFRLAENNNSTIMLVFAPVYGVASTGTYPKYAPADAPCRRTQIRRLLEELFFSASLNKPKKLGEQSKRKSLSGLIQGRAGEQRGT
jgi:hypothetical protein